MAAPEDLTPDQVDQVVSRYVERGAIDLDNAELAAAVADAARTLGAQVSPAAANRHLDRIRKAAARRGR